MQKRYEPVVELGALLEARRAVDDFVSAVVAFSASAAGDAKANLFLDLREVEDLARQGVSLRAQLAQQGAWLERRGVLAPGAVAALSLGSRRATVAIDLRALADLFADRWSSLEGAGAVTAAQVRRASELADEIDAAAERVFDQLEI